MTANTPTIERATEIITSITDEQVTAYIAAARNITNPATVAGIAEQTADRVAIIASLTKANGQRPLSSASAAHWQRMATTLATLVAQDGAAGEFHGATLAALAITITRLCEGA